jgi:uncharacterized membrane protein
MLPWPGWDGLHPLVIHFPIALLIVAPLFVVLAIILPKRGAGFGVSALVLLALGTIAAAVAVETGEAAAELVTPTEAITAAIAGHASQAEAVRNVFAVLTVLYALVLVVPRVVKRLATRTAVVVTQVVFLGLLLAGDLLLANTAHASWRRGVASATVVQCPTASGRCAAIENTGANCFAPGTTAASLPNMLCQYSNPTPISRIRAFCPSNRLASSLSSGRAMNSARVSRPAASLPFAVL